MLTPIGWLTIQILLMGLLLVLIKNNRVFPGRSPLALIPATGKQLWLKLISLHPVALIGAACLIFVVVLSGLIQYFTPISSLFYADERMYHASRVMYWLENQTVFPYVTHNDRQTVFSYGGELFFLWPVLFTQSEVVGRMVFWLGYPVAAIGLFILLQALNVNRIAAIIGCLVFVVTPIVMKYANGLKPELWLVVFLGGAAFWLVEAVQQPDRFRQHLLMAGVFIALSVNTKFTALALVPVILLIAWFIGHGQNRISGVGSVALGLVAGILLSGLIVPFSFNLINYGHILGPAAMRQVHASDLSLRQLYTHAVRLPFLLFELPQVPSPFVRESITQWGNSTIQLLGAGTPLPLERNEGWPGLYSFSLPAYAHKFSTGGLIWLPVLGVSLYDLTRNLIRTFPRIRLTPLQMVTVLDVTLLVSIVFLVRWMVDSGLPERFLIAPYAQGVAIGVTLISRFIAQRRLSRIIVLIVVALTVLPALQLQWDRAKAAATPSPKNLMQLDWPFVEALDYIPPASHILLVGAQNVPDYPLFAPQLGYPNRVVSWGKAPFEIGRLQALIETNHITHILIENDQQVDFHWDPPLETGEMVAWLTQQPDFSEVPIETGQMRLFETVEAKQIRMDAIEQQLKMLQAHRQTDIISIDPTLEDQIGLILTSLQPSQNPITQTSQPETIWLGRGEQAGLMGTLWVKDYRRLIVSLNVAPGSGQNDKQTIQLIGSINGRLIASEQALKEPTTVDFLVAVKPGPNDFLLTVVTDGPPASIVEQSGDDRQVVGLYQIMVKPAP
ncbi:MAG: glycosyltransferase family 39 protein [Anaerolineaceae bacterium]|nr:glycosyltransferase family 39 protein [Anaerolineae bacterium]MCB9080034.1 glycosyltransferase family 39 protein [Anaerolineaceae bacterium]